MGMMVAHYQMGSIYYFHSVILLELQHYLAAEKLAEKTGDRTMAALCYADLGRFYKNRRDSARAMKYLNAAYNTYKKLGNKYGMGGVMNSIGDVYESKGNFLQALASYRNSWRLQTEAGKDSGLIWPIYNIGETHMLMGQDDSALYYYATSLQIQLRLDDTGAIAYTYNSIASILLWQKNYKRAEEYALKSLALRTALDEPAGMQKANLTLSEIYEATGNYKKAYTHYRQAEELEDRMFAKDNSANIVKQQMQDEFQRREEKKQAAQSRKDLKFKAAVGLLAVLVVAAGFAFFFQRRNSRLKGALLTQKEVLMKEIHHRIKNNLQVISALLDMQIKGVADEEAKNAITESSGRLKAISVIHQQLYSADANTAIACVPFVTDLHRQISSLYGSAGQHVAFKCYIPQSMVLDVDTAVPLGLILNELMTNSYKYAFGQRGGEIVLSIKKGIDGYRLMYGDSGAGLPHGLDVAKLTTMGMKLIRSLSRQLHGAMKYDETTRRIIIDFKDIAGRKAVD